MHSLNPILSEEIFVSISGLFETPSFHVCCPFVERKLNSMKEHILFQPGGSLVLCFSSVFEKSHLPTYFWFKPLNQIYGHILIHI